MSDPVDPVDPVNIPVWIDVVKITHNEDTMWRTVVKVDTPEPQNSSEEWTDFVTDLVTETQAHAPTVMSLDSAESGYSIWHADTESEVTGVPVTAIRQMMFEGLQCYAVEHAPAPTVLSLLPAEKGRGLVETDLQTGAESMEEESMLVTITSMDTGMSWTGEMGLQVATDHDGEEAGKADEDGKQDVTDGSASESGNEADLASPEYSDVSSPRSAVTG